MTQWKIYPLARSLGDHAPAWDELKQRLFNGHPMLGSRFVNSLLKHFGDGTERLCILTVDGAAQAMCVLKPRGLGIWVTFLPSQTQVCPVLTASVENLRDLIPCLPGVVLRLDLLCVDPAFIALPDTDNATTQITDHALTMAINLDGSFESYRKSRSKKLIQNIGRYERRLAADQHARKFVQIDAPSDISAAVTRYAALESQGWKAERGTAINMADKQGVFYTELLNRFALDGDAKVFELWFDDRLVASRLAVVAGRMIVMLKTTYDENYSQYSPGRLLLHDVIERLFDTHPGHVIEFYTHANADQLAWATDQRWIKHASLYRNPLTAQAVDNARKIVRLFKPGPDSMPSAQQHLTVSAYRHPDEFPAEVLQFFAEAAATNVESSTHWFRNLVNGVFASHEGVRFYVLLDDSRPIAVLPIVAKKTAWGHTVEALANYYTALYAPLLAVHTTAQHMAHLIGAIQAAHTPITSLRFAPMDPQSNGYRTLFAALKARGLMPFKFFSFGNWHQYVQEDWPTYLKNREGTVRSTIKRMGKKFAAENGKLELILGGADLQRGVDAYQHVYALSWKQAEPYTDFAPGLIKTCAEQGWLRLGVAWLNDQPIAAQIWIVSNGKANIYKLAYDESFKAYAPGTLLTAMLMERAIDIDQVKEIDYLVGDDPYKKAWMSGRRERWGIIAYNPLTLIGMLGLIREIANRSVKSVESLFRSINITSTTTNEKG